MAGTPGSPDSGIAMVPPPQWSPPWNGGNTKPSPAAGTLPKEAAMEPAVEWREHRAVLQADLAVELAAMEPAVEWREHPGSRSRRRP